jgi:hypothetical protein
MSVGFFFWLTSLLTIVENGHVTRSQFSHIEHFGLKSMLYQRLDTYDQDDKKWQNIAKLLAKNDGEIAFKLANYYISKELGSRAENRNIELWLIQAVRLGHHKAKVILARIYFDNNKLFAAEKILLPIQSQVQALTLLIEISLLKGELKEVAYYARMLDKRNEIDQKVENRKFQHKLERYGVIKSSTAETKIDCLATIAPFATNIRNIEYFEKLIASPNLKVLKPYICFSPVQYISKIELNCQHSQNEAIRCDESIWKNKKALINKRFIAILTEKGGANVNSGILYIDSNDTEEVFFHELTHLLGFIDEYPLPKEHFRCSSVQESMFSHNIAILPRLYQGSRKDIRDKLLNALPWGKYISSDTSLLAKTPEGWILGTHGEVPDTVGAYIAESCSDINFVAIRPLKQRTSLRYFEEKFPALYIKMLADNPNKFLMPHFTHNVLIAESEK